MSRVAGMVILSSLLFVGASCTHAPQHAVGDPLQKVELHLQNMCVDSHRSATMGVTWYLYVKTVIPSEQKR